MKELMNYLFSYLAPLRFPFRIHDHYMFHIPLPHSPTGNYQLEQEESILLSWIFVFLGKAFNIIFTLFLYLYLIHNNDLTLLQMVLPSQFSLAHGFYLIIFSQMVDVLFFPLFKLLYLQVWTFFLKIFGSLLGEIDQLELKIKNLLTVSLSANFFSVIPIFGGLLGFIFEILLFYSGIKKQFAISSPVIWVMILFPGLLMLCVFSVFLFFILNLFY